MIKDYASFIEHLKRTGRLKLLPRVLTELRKEEARSKKIGTRKETAADNSSLISGWRTLENGKLIDRTGKRALIEIYQKITQP